MPTPDLDVVVLGGGGHVGLPLSLSFAKAGLRVGVLDTDRRALAMIGEGRMPFAEEGADDLLQDLLPTGRLVLGADEAMVARTGVVVIVIGTPVDEFLAPSLTAFERIVRSIGGHLRPDTLIVLRSTVYPGTTAYLQRHLRAIGVDAVVAACPERVAEGYAIQEIAGLPQIVGADDAATGDRAEALFRRLTDRTIRTTTREAELAKLFTNAWRYTKFAVANQFLMIADEAGVDVSHVFAAVKDGYPRAADLPLPGFAAGPCLFKDTMQLAAFATDHFPLGQAAMHVNEGLPAYVVSTMQRRFGDLTGRTVGILGMAFKAESDDPRASLSYKLRKLLMWAGARVLSTDPYVHDERLTPLEVVLAESEILVVGAPHKAYRALDLADREVVDVWGSIAGGIRL